jgi:hypothetical protein
MKFYTFFIFQVNDHSSIISRAVDTARESSWSRTTAHIFVLGDGLHVRFRNSVEHKFVPPFSVESPNLTELHKSAAKVGFLPGTGFGGCGSGEYGI